MSLAIDAALLRRHAIGDPLPISFRRGDYPAMPQRIQLSRAKGWRMPPNTVKVDRSTKWGNPFTVQTMPARAGNPADAFEQWTNSGAGATMAQAARAELRGKNLACWCKIGAPCHADVLLKIANAIEPRPLEQHS